MYIQNTLAVIWKTILEKLKTDGWKYSLSDPATEKILKKFYKETDYEMECQNICKQKFNSLEEHSEFIRTGGCEKLMKVLADIQD